MAIAPETHLEVKGFMASDKVWLEWVLRRCRKNGELQSKVIPGCLVGFSSALQSALLIKHATVGVNLVKDMKKALLQLLKY